MKKGESVMYKILEKKTFNQLPEKQKLIEVEANCKNYQTLFQDEESHKGLKWQDYKPEITKHLEEKYNGEDGKESFYYKIHEKFLVLIEKLKCACSPVAHIPTSTRTPISHLCSYFI